MSAAKYMLDDVPFDGAIIPDDEDLGWMVDDDTVTADGYYDEED